MPDLRRALLDHDPDVLKVIADLWGVELPTASSKEAIVEELMPALRDPVRVNEIVDGLPEEARAALTTLARGPQPAAQFAREYGPLRQMGAARREREQPWRNAPSPFETLWYRGLLASAFIDDGRGPEEFAFIPSDLIPLLPESLTPSIDLTLPGLALPVTRHSPLVFDAVDDVTTLLAYLQINAVTLYDDRLPSSARAALTPFLRQPAALDFLTHLVGALGLAEGLPFRPAAAAARPFLEAERSKQVQTLAEAWRASREWNDLKQLPGLLFEGTAWRNEPVAAREAIVRWLAHVPCGEWWSLDSFVAALKERQPDFQRRGGDYDSWYIRDAASGDYLRGFANWERVDGALIRWVIENPLCWLGLIEISTTENTEFTEKGKEKDKDRDKDSVFSVNSVVKAFRVTPYGLAFLGKDDWPAGPPVVPLLASADGLLRAPAAANRYVRFQVTRIADWLRLEEDHYAYRLTPASLERAAQRGITVGRIAAFLREATRGDAPPALLGALQRWERAGTEAALDDVVILKLKSDELLETLRATPTLRPYLGERLGPGVITVRREAADELRAALAEVGILLD
jgi:hypothetical protein